MKTLYIAGPMRFLPRLNHYAFAAAAATLRAQGYCIISPAEMDWQRGIDPDNPPVLDKVFLTEALMRDLEAIGKSCDGLVLLPGWQRSGGACVEVAFAIMLCLEIYDFPAMTEISDTLCQFSVVV